VRMRVVLLSPKHEMASRCTSLRFEIKELRMVQIQRDNFIPSKITAIGEMVGRFHISVFMAVCLQIPISDNDMGSWVGGMRNGWLVPCTAMNTETRKQTSISSIAVKLRQHIQWQVSSLISHVPHISLF
jgi:hypothetical protein